MKSARADAARAGAASAAAAAIEATFPAAGPSGGRRVCETRGTLRVRPLEETLAAIAPHIGRLGVTRIIDLTPLDRIGIPVYATCIPSPYVESYSCGKGVTREAAVVSALMEAYEYRALCEARPHARLLTLEGISARGEAVDPSRLPLPVIERFEPADRFDWIECLELVTGKRVHLPADLIILNPHSEARRASAFVDSHGKATGNSPLEAIAHALFEQVERDAYVLSNFEPTRIAEIGGLPRIADLAARVREAGAELFLLETTTDVGLPCHEALIVERCGPAEHHIHMGAGCHASREIALGRAITEACQTRLAYFAGSREDVGSGPAGEGADRALRRELERAERGTPPPPPGAERVFEDLGEIVDEIVARLVAAGLDRIYVTDLSLPGFGPVCFGTFVPGLEGRYYNADGSLRVGARARRRLGAGARRARSSEAAREPSLSQPRSRAKRRPR